jgi:hypothetical protein
MYQKNMNDQDNDQLFTVHLMAIRHHMTTGMTCQQQFDPVPLLLNCLEIAHRLQLYLLNQSVTQPLPFASTPIIVIGKCPEIIQCPSTTTRRSRHG